MSDAQAMEPGGHGGDVCVRGRLDGDAHLGAERQLRSKQPVEIVVDELLAVDGELAVCADVHHEHDVSTDLARLRDRLAAAAGERRCHQEDRESTTQPHPGPI